MLTYAFDLLYAIYEEEGYTPSQIPGLILTNNLYGTEIDPRAGALAAFALTMKAAAKRKLFLKNPVEPNVCVLEPISFPADELSYLVTGDGDRHAEEAFWNQFAEADTLGSLIQPDPALTVGLAEHLATLNDEGDIFRANALNGAQRVVVQAEYLSSRYTVVVANPPYMGTINMGERLRAFAETWYRTTYGDLCTMLLERSLGLVVSGGYTAIIASESWIFTSSYEAMRDDILRRTTPLLVACIDKSAFGVLVNTAAVILRVVATPHGTGLFFRVPADAIASSIVSLPISGELMYEVNPSMFKGIPGAPFAFDFPRQLLALYTANPTVGRRFPAKQGLATGDNGRFVRQWWEVSEERTGRDLISSDAAMSSGKKWFPYNKGGTPRPWYGRQDLVVNWENDGEAVRAFGTENGGRPRSRAQGVDYYFRPAVTWSKTGSNGARFRLQPQGFIHDINGMSIFPTSESDRLNLLGYLNCALVRAGLDVLSPTMSYQIGDVARLPLVSGGNDATRVAELVELERMDLCREETSAEFLVSPLLMESSSHTALADLVSRFLELEQNRQDRVNQLEQESSEYWVRQILAEFGSGSIEELQEAVYARSAPDVKALLTNLVSYAVGCMFGRYSLDEAGLILADQGATLREYFAKVPSATFMPDADNVIPIVQGDWFEDDIVARFRQFLRAAFGEQNFEENLHFITESLGVKHLRDYFVRSFYKEHVKRYKNRPIYWLFSSPKGSFNALIYMHRYTPSTVSMVLTYLREYVTKLESALQQAERAGNAKEADRLRKILVELNEYEHDTLFPKASENVVIDLDDGVKVNYPKFGAALKKIPGLEAASD